MNKRAYGFTIVELLIVIVIIAILAAISIVAYRGIQDRANASSAQSLASQTAKKLKLYYAEHESYPTTLTDADIPSTTGLQYTYNNTTNPKTFCITATTNNKSYYQNTTTNTIPTEGGCAGHGVGGVGAISNLMPNPVGAASSTYWARWPGSSGSSSISLVSAPWGSRGRAVRATWVTGTTAPNGDLGYNVPLNGDLILTPNTQYTASWKLRVSKTQRMNCAASLWRVENGADNSGSGTTSASSGQIVASPGTTYTQWVTFTTGPSTVSVKIFGTSVAGESASNWAAGDYMEITDFMLVQGDTVHSFADGNSQGWVWNGTQDNSTSTGPAL